MASTVCQKVIEGINASVVVCDFSPIRQFRTWLEIDAAPLFEAAGVPLYQVDAHNIVPVWAAADKRQVGARTLRPRIHKVVKDYMQDFPELEKNTMKVALPDFQRQDYESFMQMDESVPPVKWAKPGTVAGMKQLGFFFEISLVFLLSSRCPSHANPHGQLGFILQVFSCVSFVIWMPISC